METKSITINIPEGKIPVWKELNGMTLLTLEDEIDNRPVTERIKTFNDAKKELGDGHPLVVEYNAMLGIADLNTRVYLKLRIITEALNEGWEGPSYNQAVYYPGFYLCSEKEADINRFNKLWRWGDYTFNGSWCGFACSGSDNVWADSHTHVSPLLAYKTKELAAYSFKQFNDLWADYLLPHPIQKV